MEDFYKLLKKNYLAAYKAAMEHKTDEIHSMRFYRTNMSVCNFATANLPKETACHYYNKDGELLFSKVIDSVSSDTKISILNYCLLSRDLYSRMHSGNCYKDIIQLVRENDSFEEQAGYNFITAFDLGNL